MTSEARWRRYLLGIASEEERAAIEREYFANGQQLDRIAAAEDELIEDYLEDRLSDDERDRFERAYLASPAHRTRVDTIRRLSMRATVSSGSAARAGRPVYFRWLAAAAALLLAIVGLWTGARIVSRRDAPHHQAAGSPPPSSVKPLPEPPGEHAQPSTPALPRIFAVALSPLTLRSAGESSRAVVPEGTDQVDLRFEIQPGAAPSPESTVAVATVSGEQVWHGRAMRDGNTLHALVPASVLRPDDYIVTLRGGAEESRYFLRVRAR
jgi:hypothetical protein